MGLTVAEKEHWKDVFSRQIEDAIETRVSKEDPAFLRKVKIASEKAAVKSLGLTKLRAQRERLRAKIKKMEAQVDALNTKEKESLPGFEMRPNEPYTWRSGGDEILQAIESRAKVHELEILERTPLGRFLLKMRKERETVLNAVWLATTTSQLKDLWKLMGKLTGRKDTDVEGGALSIPGVVADKP